MKTLLAAYPIYYRGSGGALSETEAYVIGGLVILFVIGMAALGVWLYYDSKHDQEVKSGVITNLDYHPPKTGKDSRPERWSVTIKGLDNRQAIRARTITITKQEAESLRLAETYTVKEL